MRYEATLHHIFSFTVLILFLVLVLVLILIMILVLILILVLVLVLVQEGRVNVGICQVQHSMSQYKNPQDPLT
jgi:uncharacterized membrane protein